MISLNQNEGGIVGEQLGADQVANRRAHMKQACIQLAKVLYLTNAIDGSIWACGSKGVFSKVETALFAALRAYVGLKEAKEALEDMYKTGELFGIYVQG